MDPQYIFSAVAAISTFIYTVLTILIWRAAAENTKATRQIIESAYRPYIAVEAFELIRPDTLMGEFSLVARIKNVGTTPGTRIELNYELSVEGQEAARNPGGGPHTTLFPDTRFSMTVALTHPQTTAMHSGLKTQLSLRIRYNGATDKQYSTDCGGMFNHESQEFEITSGHCD